MLDLNEVRGLEQLFRDHGVEDLIELFAKFPEYDPAAGEESAAEHQQVHIPVGR